MSGAFCECLKLIEELSEDLTQRRVFKRAEWISSLNMERRTRSQLGSKKQKAPQIQTNSGTFCDSWHFGCKFA